MGKVARKSSNRKGYVGKPNSFADFLNLAEIKGVNRTSVPVALAARTAKLTRQTQQTLISNCLDQIFKPNELEKAFRALLLELRKFGSSSLGRDTKLIHNTLSDMVLDSERNRHPSASLETRYLAAQCLACIEPPKNVADLLRIQVQRMQGSLDESEQGEHATGELAKGYSRLAKNYSQLAEQLSGGSYPAFGFPLATSAAAESGPNHPHNSGIGF